MTEYSGTTDMVGVELMGWTNVSKGSRSGSRRSRKPASTSQEACMEQFDKIEDLSTSESEKIGASILERRFSSKAEHIPFKKRNILFCPISPSSSSPSSSSLPPQGEDYEKPRTRLHTAEAYSGSISKGKAKASSAGMADDDGFIGNIFETKELFEEDFSGIKMLATVACNDGCRVDEVTDIPTFSSTPSKINPGENMTHKTDDYGKNDNSGGRYFGNSHSVEKESEPDFSSSRYSTNESEFPTCSSRDFTICSSSTFSRNLTAIKSDRNDCGLSYSRSLSRILEEIKEEDCPSPAGNHENDVSSHHVQIERSSSLLSDEHEDSGVTCGSNSDADCPKSILDGADALKFDSRGSKTDEVAGTSHGLPSTGNARNSRNVFTNLRENDNGVLDSSNLVPKCVISKDDSSRVGVNHGGGDSELEDGEFRDSLVQQLEGSGEAEYGELEQVDYDSDDKDAFEVKEITPEHSVGSMEDETVDAESCKRLLTKYSRTHRNIGLLRKEGVNRLLNFRKAGMELGAESDGENGRNDDDIARNCRHSTCLRSRHRHYDQKHYKDHDFSSYITRGVIDGYSSRRANVGRGPMLKRYAAGPQKRSPEPENTYLYPDRFVRMGRPFLREPVVAPRPWDTRPAARHHSPYYGRPTRSRPSVSGREFRRTRVPGYAPLVKVHSPGRDGFSYRSPPVACDGRRRQRLGRSISPDGMWMAQGYLPHEFSPRPRSKFSSPQDRPLVGRRMGVPDFRGDPDEEGFMTRSRSPLSPPQRRAAYSGRDWAGGPKRRRYEQYEVRETPGWRFRFPRDGFIRRRLQWRED